MIHVDKKNKDMLKVWFSPDSFHRVMKFGVVPSQYYSQQYIEARAKALVIADNLWQSEFNKK